MRYIVVDASVALKWALDDEEHVEQAVALRDAAVLQGRFQMLAPSLWVYEMTNGFVVAVRRGRIDPATGAEALQHILALGVRLVDPSPSDVYWEAERLGIAAYDAAYLALARTVNGPVWTGDRRFYEAVRGKTSLVQWIGDFHLPETQ